MIIEARIIIVVRTTMVQNQAKAPASTSGRSGIHRPGSFDLVENTVEAHERCRRPRNSLVSADDQALSMGEEV